MLDDRAKLLLKVLVERYIADGQPIGSRTLSRSSGLELSPATIRNVMADLEELGLIASPHTSAGRIPTARGYRLFVDTMLTAQRQALVAPQLPAEQPQEVIANAAHLLSNLSQFVGVVMAPKRSSVFKQIEFVKLSERRGAGHHRRPRWRRAKPRHVHRWRAGQQPAHRSGQLPQQPLRRAGHRTSARTPAHRSGTTAQPSGRFNASGREYQRRGAQPHNARGASGDCRASNLLAVSDFSHDMHNLRRAFDLFEQKAKSCACWTFPARPKGVRIFIGGESHIVPIEELSVVSAPTRWTAKSSAPWA